MDAVNMDGWNMVENGGENWSICAGKDVSGRVEQTCHGEGKGEGKTEPKMATIRGEGC